MLSDNILLYVTEIPPAERITEATHANNANKVTHTTTEQIEISKYTTAWTLQTRCYLVF